MVHVAVGLSFLLPSRSPGVQVLRTCYHVSFSLHVLILAAESRNAISRYHHWGLLKGAGFLELSEADFFFCNYRPILQDFRFLYEYLCLHYSKFCEFSGLLHRFCCCKFRRTSQKEADVSKHSSTLYRKKKINSENFRDIWMRVILQKQCKCMQMQISR